MFANEFFASSPIAPPNPPWVELGVEPSGGGYLSIYYSDRLSRLPVREVTRPGDNKSDPNLETGTFGLFSTCERNMRAGVRSRSVGWIFFITSHRGRPRALTGFYEVGWWAYGKLAGIPEDVCLAAKRIHFVDPPLALSDLPNPARQATETGFHNVKLVGEEIVDSLVAELLARPDATTAYWKEIDRLERFNRHHTGYRCWRRTKPFAWEDAESLVAASPPSGHGRGVPNSSPSGRWRCVNCKHSFANSSRLKECPGCHEHDTLVPEE